MGLTHFNATLPAGVLPEDDAQALVRFMDLLFHPALPNSFYIQMYVVAGTTITFVLAALAIVIRRFAQRTAWLVQFFPTSAGTYIIPNAVMSLCSCIFAYTAVYSAYVFVIVQHYQSDRFAKRFFLWRQLVWWPLWLGAWLCAWGTLSAFPDALRMRGKGGVRRNFVKPLHFNITWMSGPVVCLASLLGPTILASDLYDAQLPRHAAWRAAALASSPAALPQLVAEARDIWLNVTRAYWYYAWTMAIWTTWACIVVLVFVPIGAHTIWRVRAQVQLARKRDEALHSFQFFPSAELDGRDDAVGGLRPVFRTSDGEAGYGTESKQATRGSPDAGKEVGVATLYPPMKRERHNLSAGAAASRRKELLQLLYRNIVIQYFGISAGAATFATSAGLLAGEAYHSARYNTIGRNQMIANLIAGYAAAVFGSAVIVAVLWRSFDSSLTLSPEPEEHVAHAERPRPFFALLGAHKAEAAKQSLSVGVRSQQSVARSTTASAPFLSLTGEEEQIATQRSGGMRRGSAATSSGSYRSSTTHTHDPAERRAKGSDAGHESITALPSPVRTRRGSASRAKILRGTRSGSELSNGGKSSPRKATTAPSTPTHPSSMQFATPYGVIRAEPAERSPPLTSPPTMPASPGGGSWKSSRQQVLDATQHASILPRSRYGAWRSPPGTEDSSNAL